MMIHGTDRAARLARIEQLLDEYRRLPTLGMLRSRRLLDLVEKRSDFSGERRCRKI
jgi:hypothetical protein